MRGQDIRKERSEGGKTLERKGVRGQDIRKERSEGGKTLERQGVRGARH